MAGNDVIGDRRAEHDLDADVSGAVMRLIRESRPLSHVAFRQAAMMELVRARASAALSGMEVVDLSESPIPSSSAEFFEKVNRARSMLRIAMEKGEAFHWDDLHPDVAVMLWAELQRLLG